MTADAHGRRASFRPNIPMYLAVLVALIATAEGVGYYAEQRRTLDRAERVAREHVGIHASVSADRIAEALATAASGSEALAANPGLSALFQPGPPPPGCSLTFTGAGPFASGRIHVVDGSGSVRCSSLDLPAGEVYAEAPWLAAALEAPAIEGPFLDPVTGEDSVVVSAPVPAGGAVATIMPLSSVEEELSAVSAVDRPVRFQLVHDRQPVAADDDEFTSTAEVEPLGWTLVAGLDRDLALERAHTSNRMLLLGLAGSLTVLIVGTGLVYLGLARPIRRLSSAVRSGIQGPAPDPDQVGGPAEVARIADDFSQLRHEVTAELELRRQAERDAATSREYYRRIFATNPIPMWIYDADIRRILEANDAAVERYGYSREQFTSMTIDELWPVEPVDPTGVDATRAAATGADGTDRSAGAPSPEVGSAPDRVGRWTTSAAVPSGPGRHVLSDGVVIDVEVTAHPVEVADLPAVLVMAEDVTARDRARRVLERSERMESLGQLAGGIAHDFNNVLAVMLSYAEFAGDELATAAREDPARWAPVLSDVEQISAAGHRAATLTHQLLAFARGESAEVGPVDLNDVTREAQRMLRRTLGEQVDLELALDDDLWAVVANSGQMVQVIVNLAVNARDAMPDGGRLLIESSNVIIGDDEVVRRPGLSAGPHVRLRVSDTGNGMDATTREHAFEPLFSTKGRGQGTGLGLATVYGIVRRAGGEVHLYSEPGLGTTVNILLPAAGQAAGTVAPAGEAATGAAAVTGSILLVEDDDDLRAVTERILTEAGHTVVTAAAGSEAEALFADAPVDLLLTDVVMPEMAGPELAQRLTGRDPQLRVLFMSGYAPPLLFADGRMPHGATLIDKPFSASALLSRVRETMVGAPPAAAASSPGSSGPVVASNGDSGHAGDGDGGPGAAGEGGPAPDTSSPPPGSQP